MTLPRGVIFDLDGTVHRGGALLPGVGNTIALLRREGIRVLFVSNNPTSTSDANAKYLTVRGIPVEPIEVLTSGGVATQWLRENHPQARVLVVGETSFIAELNAADVEVVFDGMADIVLVSFDRTFDYSKWKAAFRALRGGALFVATNADMTCPVLDGETPDCGGIIAALESTVGRPVDVVIGKPSAIMAKAALARLDVRASEAVIVGDRLQSDVAMGAHAGVDTALVLTGVSTRADVDAGDLLPTYILDSVSDFPAAIGIRETAEV